MRWLLVALLVLGACRSQPTSPSPAPPPSPARIAIHAPVVPALAPEPVLPSLPEALPWVDPDEPEVGAIAGVVVDPNNEPLAGVTIILSAPSLDHAEAAITNEEGAYAVEELPPDDYVVTLYYIDMTVERHVHVDDKLVEVSQTIDYKYEPVTISFGCGGVNTENTYIVDGIDTTGLTFGE